MKLNALRNLPKDLMRTLTKKKSVLFFERNRFAEKIFEEWYQPILGQEIKKFLSTLNRKIIFADMPFLAQKKISKLFDEIWVIEARFENCVQRIRARNNYDTDKIKYLIDRSLVREEIYNSADKIIVNKGSFETFRNELKRNLKLLKIRVTGNLDFIPD